jgi:hypothetical protein
MARSMVGTLQFGAHVAVDFQAECNFDHLRGMPLTHGEVLQNMNRKRRPGWLRTAPARAKTTGRRSHYKEARQSGECDFSGGAADKKTPAAAGVSGSIKKRRNKHKPSGNRK